MLSGSVEMRPRQQDDDPTGSARQAVCEARHVPSGTDWVVISETRRRGPQKRAYANGFPAAQCGSWKTSYLMSQQSVTTEDLDGTVRLRLTNGTTNTLTTEVLLALSTAVTEAVANDQAILLCGGDEFFSNGVDIGWALGQDQAGIGAMFSELGNVMLSLLEAPVPVGGALKGHAVGGAKSMFLACDYRYAAIGRLLVGAPEIVLGIPNPDYTDRLVRFVAADLVGSDPMCTGKLVKAEDAVELGLVHEVALAAEVEDLALKQLRLLNGMARQAFAESKNMRVGAFCSDVRAQMSSMVARQVEVWNDKEAQLLLTAAAERLEPPK